MKLFVAGVSYKTAPVEVREKLAVSRPMLACSGCRLRLAGGLDEVVVLATCNRVEVYGTAAWPKAIVHRIFATLAGDDFDFTPHIYHKEGVTAAEHLFAVASGLDSMVLGETEITGQVKHAYETAKAQKLTGRVLNRLFQTALQVGKEIRTHTAVGRGAVSVGSAAVELAGRIFDNDLSRKTVMILGAGKMGETCVRHLAKKGIRSVLVSNRSFEKAQGLAAEFGGRAVRFDECFGAMQEADIVVSSTGCPHTVIHRRELEAAMAGRRDRPLFLVDIAVPRDIAPDVQELENVYLYNIDHLETIVRENLRSREQELSRCRNIIASRAADFLKRIDPQSSRPVKNARPLGEWSPGTAVLGAAY